MVTSALEVRSTVPCWVCGCMFEIPTLRRQKQEDHGFADCLGYAAKSYFRADNMVEKGKHLFLRHG